MYKSIMTKLILPEHKDNIFTDFFILNSLTTVAPIPCQAFVIKHVKPLRMQLLSAT